MSMRKHLNLNNALLPWYTLQTESAKPGRPGHMPGARRPVDGRSPAKCAKDGGPSYALFWRVTLLFVYTI